MARATGDVQGLRRQGQGLGGDGQQQIVGQEIIADVARVRRPHPDRQVADIGLVGHGGGNLPGMVKRGYNIAGQNQNSSGAERI